MCSYIIDQYDRLYSIFDDVDKMCSIPQLTGMFLVLVTTEYVLLARLIQSFIRRHIAKTSICQPLITSIWRVLTSLLLIFLSHRTLTQHPVDVRARTYSVRETLFGGRLYITDIYRGENTIVALIGACVLHRTWLAWYDEGVAIFSLKETCLAVAHGLATVLSLTTMGSSIVLVSSCTDIWQQLAKICYSCIKNRTQYLSTLFWSFYIVVWCFGYLLLLPAYFLGPAMSIKMEAQKIHVMLTFCGALFWYHILEVVTSPVVKMGRYLIWGRNDKTGISWLDTMMFDYYASNMIYSDVKVLQDTFKDQKIVNILSESGRRAKIGTDSCQTCLELKDILEGVEAIKVLRNVEQERNVEEVISTAT